MPILRLIAKIQNVLPVRKATSTKQRRFTLAELQELAERNDFGEILTAAGVLDTSIPEAREKRGGDLESGRSKLTRPGIKRTR